MPTIRETVIHPTDEAGVLPSWSGRFATVWRLLERWGVVAAVHQHVLLERKDGYSALDLLLVAVAVFCRPSASKAIKTFLQECQQHGTGSALAAVGERRQLPTQASASRMLTSVTDENVDAFVTHAMPLIDAQWPLLARAAATFLDGHGTPWHVFDLDGVVRAFRERALPEGIGLPAAKRRNQGAPGYNGRKRGETQTSRHRLNHCGSGLWVGQRTVPGNSHMAEGIEDAVRWLRRVVSQLGIDPARVVLRMDGAGGNNPCARLARGAGLHVLARSARYDLLKTFAVRLAEEIWHPVEDSLSGPSRHAAELCVDVAADVPMRVVVSRFASRDGAKHGAGHVVGRSQLELYVTSLPDGAFTAEDVVTLYYNRSSGENQYASLSVDLGGAHTFSYNTAGQDLMELIAMLVWNVATVAGAQMCPPQELPASPKRQRGERRACSWNEPALLEWAAPEVPAAAVSPALLGTPGNAVTHPAQAVRVDLTKLTSAQVLQMSEQLEEKPGFTWQAGLVCPRGQRMPLHNALPKADGCVTLVMRGRRATCSRCPLRPRCTTSVTPKFAKEVWLTVSGEWALAKPRTAPSQAQATTNSAAVAFSVIDPLPAPATPMEPGEYLPTWPSLCPSKLRLLFWEHSLRAALTVDIGGSRPAPPMRSRYTAANAAERQHRRRSWNQRVARNAIPGSCRTILRSQIAAELCVLFPGHIQQIT